MADLHVMREHTLLDVPAVLREIASDIESGTYGEVKGCVVVLDALKLGVFYSGSGEAGPNAHLLLHAGATKMMNAVMEEKT